jgi:protease I
VALTDATYVKIGPEAALRDGNMVTAEGWTALAAFMREFMAVLGTEVIHHPIGALDQTQAAE